VTRVGLEAIAYALPEAILHNDQLHAEHPDWNLERSFSRSGVVKRHIAAPHETALDLAVAACRKLDAQDQLRAREVGAVIFCTQTPDYVLPGNASLLQRRLGLRSDVMAFDLPLGCSGFVYALGVARSLIVSGTAERVLVVTADTYSRLIHPGDRASRVLFGDGGAATMVSAEAHGWFLADMTFGSDGSNYDRFIIRAGGARMPRGAETAREVTDHSGNVRTAEHIEMDGLGVLSFFNTVVPNAVAELLARNRLTHADVDWFVLHQASRVALEGIARGMHVDPARVIVDIADTGNLVSASIPVALARASAAGRIKPRQLIVICGFGVGLSWATAILET
jgi:3-oxoacyl-[acyl-carrier-protein] synthase-3